jgi:hypothetical protein
MASSSNAVALGYADTEAQIAAKLAAFTASVSYPFDIVVSNSGERPLVFPFLHGEIVQVGGSSNATINEFWQISELFYSAQVLGGLHDANELISVSMVSAAKAAKETA